MIKAHEERFVHYSQPERLVQAGLTPTAYSRLKHRSEERARRESVIMEDEVSAAVELIIAHPHLGSSKLHLTLIDQEKSMISAGFLNEAKTQIAEQVEQLYRDREEAARTLESALRDREVLQEPYVHIQPTCPHDIWAVDFVFIAFLGFRLTLCVVYDIFTQGYMSIACGTGCTAELAGEALDQAVTTLGEQPCSFLRRDNGKAFVAESVQAFLASYEIIDQPIPPGQPWFNGSLESNNGNLKNTIKATALQLMATNPRTVGQGRRDVDSAVALLQEVCETTRGVLNVEISRPKFQMPPQAVLDNKITETQARHEQFKTCKTAERAKRMATLRACPDRPERGKTFLDKIGQLFRKKARDISTNTLFAINEIIHGRYAAIET
jgi:hypothetical protein